MQLHIKVDRQKGGNEMGLMERVYSVLLVSSSSNLNGNIASMLPGTRYFPINIVGNVSAAKRAVAERDFDFVIVNSPLADDDGLRFCIDAASMKETVVLLMVRSELYPELFEKFAEYGVFLMQKPFSRSTLLLSFDWLTSARERLRMSEKKVLSFKEKMDEIRLVNRAKWLLISELKMAEPDAHRYIEKQAMDRCVQRRVVAEEIIKTYG